MSGGEKDPTEPIRKKASRYPDVEVGTSCTQTSFKTNKKAFLYIGMQGGRYKAMFKLQDSKAEAVELASAEPNLYQAGSSTWVTARFSSDAPMPKKIWEKWLEESYRLSTSSKSVKKSVRKSVAKKK